MIGTQQVGKEIEEIWSYVEYKQHGSMRKCRKINWWLSEERWWF